MCGITGIFRHPNRSEAAALVLRMNDALAHRGPDDKGVFDQAEVALGHRRLSIIDLSAAGHQPMSTPDGRLTIVYNGELYNYKEVKTQLRNFSFKTTTDTEVILASYQEWGKECLNRFNGMFALAIWDNEKNELFIARDRLGIKPLYCYRRDGMLAFASELRALLASGLVPRRIDTDSLADYLRYQTVHAPATIVKDVTMLLPGHYLLAGKNGIEEKPYWELGRNKARLTDKATYPEVCAEVRKLLSAAVERRLVSDVPFGAFLSGGIDSSAVVGLMSQVSSVKVKTFFIDFAEEEFSEAKYASQVAKKFGTEHRELKLSAKDFLQQLPDALKAMDHPSGDGPNSYLVSKVTKQAGITMALSGLGGDELFCGYDIFRRSQKLRKMRWLLGLPRFARSAGGSLLQTIRPGVASDKIAALLRSPRSGFQSSYPLSRRVLLDEQVARLLSGTTLPPDALQAIVSGQGTLFDDEHLLSRVSAAEMAGYMQNVLLRDTDQMSMAHALEVRVPFLDFELVEYVLALPDRFKDPVTPKKLLVDSLGELLPAEIVNRPKMGFTFPWKHWMKNEMRSFCEEQIHAFSRRGFVQGGEVIHLWNAFLGDDPRVTWSRIWYLIVLETWLRENDLES